MTSITSWIEMTKALTKASCVLQRAWRSCAPALRRKRARRRLLARKVLKQWRGVCVKAKLRLWIANQPATSTNLVAMLERTRLDDEQGLDIDLGMEIGDVLRDEPEFFVPPPMDEPFVADVHGMKLPDVDAIPRYLAAVETRVLVLMVGTESEANDFHAAVGQTCFAVEWQYVEIGASLFGMNKSSRVWKELSRLRREDWCPDLVVFSCHGVAGTEGMAYVPLGSTSARLTHGVWPMKDLISEWRNVAGKCFPALATAPLHLDVCFGMRGLNGRSIGHGLYELERSATNPATVTGFEGGPVSCGSPWVISVVLRACVPHKGCGGI